ncbi:GmrSD restriction endonuclease domain-containing protein, partial [Lactobacillus helveticus]
MVYLESTNSDIGLPEYLIIDGQQRLTTITLMLQALKDATVDGDAFTTGTIESFLINTQSPSQEYKIKLKPIKSDNIQYSALLKHDNYSALLK